MIFGGGALSPVFNSERSSITSTLESAHEGAQEKKKKEAPREHKSSRVEFYSRIKGAFRGSDVGLPKADMLLLVHMGKIYF